MNKLYIAIELIKLLNENRRVTTKQVADLLDVSLRTAQRYMSEMTYIPGVCYNEEEHFWYLADKYAMSDSYLHGSELGIITALFGYAKSVIGDDDAGLIEKIKRKILTASNSSSSIHFLAEQSIDFSEISDTFHNLQHLISTNSELSFYYTKKDKHYTVTPFKLTYHDGFWYITALHDNILKKFSLDKIENIKPTGELGKPIPEKELIQFEKAKNIFFSSADIRQIIIEIDKELAGNFLRKQLLPDQKIISENENGSIVLSFTSGSTIECMSYLQKWIPFVKIIEPVEYKQTLNDILKKALDFNK